jgi:putative hemin transport protein
MSMAMPQTPADASNALALRWRAYRAEHPKVRIRDAARSLGVSEAELVATGSGDTAIRLQARHWGDVIKSLPALGPVMALTRNDDCVHERHGTYGEVSVNGAMGLVLGEDIDLRLFLNRWRFGFAVREATAHGERRSLQFFDGAGQAVHKIYATEHTNVVAFSALVGQFTASDADAPLTIEAPTPAPAARPDSAIDVAGLRDAWSKLGDTHDFFGMLKKFGVGRTQALRLAGREFAEPLRPSAARRTLEIAAERQVPIMVFVGNPGCIQIHTGLVTNLKPVGPWFNVLDPQFNLHLREDKVDNAWIVHKPTRDGAVTSIELFDAAGGTVAQLFGKRKPGLPELPEWRAIVDGVRATEAR